MLYYSFKDNQKKKTVLFLHCICEDSTIFDNQIERYSTEYNILCIDLPGHGNSISYSVHFTYIDIVEEIIFILDKLQLKQVDIVALSLGTIVTSYLMLQHPDRVRKVVMEGSAFGFPFAFLKYMLTLFNKIKIIFPRWLYLKLVIFFIIPKSGSKKYRKSMFQNAMNMDKKTLFCWFSLMEKAFYDFDKYLIEHINHNAIEKLYLIGENDFACLRKTKKSVLENEKNTLMVLKNCGHLCHIDQENTFSNISLSFLRDDDKNRK